MKQLKIGIIGAGMIGKLVIEMLKAYRLKVLVFDPFLPDEKAEELGVKRVACNVDGTSRKMVKAAHKAGYKVNLWPGNSVEDFQLALSLGADVACTDYPVQILEFVKAKMPWVNPRKDIR